MRTEIQEIGATDEFANRARLSRSHGREFLRKAAWHLKLPYHPLCRPPIAMPRGARPNAASSTRRAAAHPSDRLHYGLGTGFIPLAGGRTAFCPGPLQPQKRAFTDRATTSALRHERPMHGGKQHLYSVTAGNHGTGGLLTHLRNRPANQPTMHELTSSHLQWAGFATLAILNPYPSRARREVLTERWADDIRAYRPVPTAGTTRPAGAPATARM